MEVYLRYCPDCGEEYQPHMTRCIECGAALRDLLEGEVPDVAAHRPVEPSLPPGDYRELIDGLAGSTAHRLVQLCASAGIPVKVASARSGLGLSARAEERPAVLAILEKEGLVPGQPDPSEPVVAVDGGPCPACGTELRPGVETCTECGLQLGGPAGCEACGADLSPTDHKCPSCGQSL